MQKIYYQCKKCNSEMQEIHCNKCDSDKDVIMIIFNGTNKIPVRYIEEEKLIEPIPEPTLKEQIRKPTLKQNIWSELECLKPIKKY